MIAEMQSCIFRLRSRRRRGRLCLSSLMKLSFERWPFVRAKLFLGPTYPVEAVDAIPKKI